MRSIDNIDTFSVIDLLIYSRPLKCVLELGPFSFPLFYDSPFSSYFPKSPLSFEIENL